MPADDFVINVKQIAGYPPATAAPPGASLLMQLGLGGPYQSISPPALVGTALAASGEPMAIGGPLTAASFTGGPAQFTSANIDFLSSGNASFGSVSANGGAINGVRIATVDDVASSVTSFNGRIGAVTLFTQDIVIAGGAPIHAPRFSGDARSQTPDQTSNSSRVATTAFVQTALATALENFLTTQPLVFTFNGRSGNVVLTAADIVAVGGEVFDSPTFTGIPLAPTAPPGTNTDQIATTAFVQTAVGSLGTIYAPLASPQFTGFPSAPTAPTGTSTGQLATTAFVQAAVTESTTGVSSWNGRTGAVTLTATDISSAGGAELASPIFTGVPTAPTAAPGTANQQIATTAFVAAAIGANVASFNGRTGVVTLNSADITAASGALLASPGFTGSPTAPTAAPGTSTTQLATTAFVSAAITGAVSSFNGRTGAITLTANDISAAGGAPSASPTFSGVPLAPTAAPGTNTTQIATTAYVQTAIAAGGGVLSFNGRAGAVTLTTADITGAGGAPLASPAFTGTPVAPTAGTGTNTTQLATTAFVLAQIAASGPAASTAAPLMNGVASAGSSAAYSRGDHVHPTDTTRFPTTGGLISGATSIGGVLTLGANLILATSFQTANAALGAFSNAPNINYLTSTGLIVEHNSAPVVTVNRSQVGVGLAVIQFFQNSSANTGSISVSNQATTQFNTSSDGRLKEDRRPIKSGELIDAIEVYDFRWKAPISRSGREVRGHGVIAQDVFEIFPDAISHDTDADTWGADYSKFVPMLIAETKALRIRVAQLEARS